MKWTAKLGLIALPIIAIGLMGFAVNGIFNNITAGGTLGVTGASTFGNTISATGQINSTAGYQQAGAAPSNHILLGDGSHYVDASTLPSAALPTSGTAGTYTFPSSVTTDPQGRVTAISSGAQDQMASISGCSFSDDGGGRTCSAGTLTFPASFANSSYSVGCWTMYSSAIAGGSSTQPAIILNATITGASTVSITEGVAQGSSGGYVISSSYGATIVCHGHHN